MQLSRKSSARLEKLIDALLIYCAKERRPELLSEGKLKEGALPAAADIVWADDGDLTLIDTFVKTNPAKLNRTDLRQVFSWKKALAGDFCFCRHDKDTVLLAGDYAFCVRGTDEELDSAYSEFPMYAQTIILPFDGVLAHVGFAIISPIEDDLDAWNQKLLSAVDFIAGHHNLIRTERQFLQVAEDVGIGDRPYLPQLSTHEEDKTARSDSSDEAGLYMPILEDEDIEALEDCALEVEPTCDYYDILMLYPRDMLRRIAWDEDIIFDSNELLAMSDEELAKYMVENQVVSDVDVLQSATNLGYEVVETLRRVHDAHGILKVNLEDEYVRLWQFDELGNVLFLFKYLGSYYFVMPHNVLCALDDINWDYYLRRARRIEIAISKLEDIVDKRGAVEFEPTAQTLFNGASDIDDWEAYLSFRLALAARITYPSTTVRVVYAPIDCNGKDSPVKRAYAVSLKTHYEVKPDGNDNVTNLDVLRRYLTQQ